MLPLGELHQIVIDTTSISIETENYKMLIKTINYVHNKVTATDLTRI